MTDNVVADPGAGGATFASDDIGGVQYPRSKVVWGPDGTANDTDDASGKRLPVKVGEALPAGTNNIGDVDVLTLPALPAGTNNIGDVDVLTVPAPLNVVGGGAQATALRVTLADDSTGVVSVDDNGGSLTVDGAVTVSGTVDTELTTADLDTGAGTDTRAVVGLVSAESGGGVLVGSANPLPVSAASLPLPTGAATEATLAAAAASLSVLDDWDESDRAKVNPIAGQAGVQGGSGVVTALTQRVVLATDVALPAGGNNIGDVDVLSLPALPAGTNNIGDVDVLTVPAPLSTTGGGTEAAALRVTVASDSTGVLSVDDNGGSLTIDGTVTAAGAAAHGAGVSGNPVPVGLEGRTTDGTPVDSADVVRALGDTLGKQVVLQGAVHDLQSNGTATYTNTTAADVIAAAGAGVRIAVTSILVTNAHATVGTKVEIRDGTTVKIQGYAAAVGGGFALNAGGRPLFITTANTAVTARCVTTGADVDVSISGYRIAN